MSLELDGKRVLVIEDDYLIAEQLTELLADAGATVLGPFGWLDEARQVAGDGTTSIDLALVDVNLHGETSYPAVDILLGRGIRVVFMSGYGPDSISPGYEACRQCAKPFSRRELLEALVG